MLTVENVRSEFKRCFGIDMGLTEQNVIEAIASHGHSWRMLLMRLHLIAWARTPAQSDWLEQPISFKETLKHPFVSVSNGNKCSSCNKLQSDSIHE